MRWLSRVWLLSILIIAANAFAQINVVNFDFGAVPIVCGQNYAYQGHVSGCTVRWVWPFQDFNSTPGFGWTLSGIPGIRTGGSALTGPNTSFLPPPFNGVPFTQALALQGTSFAWQTIAGFTAGSYTLSFYPGSRYSSGQYDGNQIVQVFIDGNLIGTWSLISYTPFTLQSVPFTVSTAGSHTLEFRGIRNYDSTAFLSYVVITPIEQP
ncbi:MAG TPA: hypothetical protein VKB58_12560 [Terriglobales bacterium]|jgi:hypothetical protein|nr:hypothetical protein [Terriglobales bacterium]